MEDVTFIIKDGDRKKTITLSCDPQSDEIGEIKERIEGKYDYPVKRQRFYYHGEEMHNDSILNNFDFDRSEHIDVDIIPAPFIEIVGEDKTIEVDYNCYDRVQSLFQQVAKSWGLEEQQIALVNWKNLKLLDKRQLLSDYQIDGNDENKRRVRLRIQPKDTIEIKVYSIDGGDQNFKIPSSGTVLKLKEEIGKLENRDTNSIQLMFKGKQLANDATLNSLGIVNGTHLFSQSRLHGGGQKIFDLCFS
ncbi:unnamed protein product [Rodentolepis nana]|uniref:Ubiquitin-like domain-containing protein n=1 Tax=Rodentolepis nana TaxID=102285 RepID=A0A0R3U066_RODNA|nr:unnamed protein product [Rodentolepis nana]